MIKSGIISVFLLLAGGGLFAQALLAGVAVKKITPEPLLPVSGGVGVPKVAKEKKGELFIRALVLKQDTTKVALVSIDNLGWPAVLGNKSRALIKSIKPENILIAATHTHSAPDAYGFPDETGKSYADRNYLDFCVKEMAAAIVEAEQSLIPVDLKLAFGEIAGGIAYNYYAPELYDRRCGVMQFLDKKNGKPMCTLINYAVHPEVIGSKRGILSPDLCGPLYDYVEENGGGTTLFFNGALGGMVTADNRRDDGEANSWEECIRLGNLLGKEALMLIEKASINDSPLLKSKYWKVELPVESPIMNYILKNSPLGYTLNKNNKVETIQNLLQIGDAKVITMPGEALPNIGFYLKRKMKTPFPFLFGLTNDAFGYILSKEDFNSFKRYDYISRTSLGGQTGDILVNEIIKHLKQNDE